mmetsp:Transcript_41441/g.110880  ORF Transcript_41441/g.110880 Transcript_41441/m.110880 type:complete len:272 (+) Transcript_41441:1318-2133(+)
MCCPNLTNKGRPPSRWLPTKVTVKLLRDTTKRGHTDARVGGSSYRYRKPVHKISCPLLVTPISTPITLLLELIAGTLQRSRLDEAHRAPATRPADPKQHPAELLSAKPCPNTLIIEPPFTPPDKGRAPETTGSKKYSNTTLRCNLCPNLTATCPPWPIVSSSARADLHKKKPSAQVHTDSVSLLPSFSTSGPGGSSGDCPSRAPTPETCSLKLVPPLTGPQLGTIDVTSNSPVTSSNNSFPDWLKSNPLLLTCRKRAPRGTGDLHKTRLDV